MVVLSLITYSSDFNALFNKWEEEGCDIDDLWVKIKKAVVKTILSAEAVLTHWAKKQIPCRFDFSINLL